VPLLDTVAQVKVLPELLVQPAGNELNAPPVMLKAVAVSISVLKVMVTGVEVFKRTFAELGLALPFTLLFAVAT
jgi:hypothetical protein